MVFIRGLWRPRVGSGGMEYEGREVHGDEAVEAYDGWLASFEGKNHVPDGGGVEGGESGAKPPWGPIQNGHGDDIW